MNRTVLRALAAGLLAASPSLAQPDIPGKVPIAFNRYYTYAEFESHLKAIAAAYPELVELRSLGKSLEGRDLWLAIVNSPKTGPHTSKPAMWIDGNVHGNEIQAGEAVLYSIWYLTKAYGQVPDLTKLLDSYSFYFLPSQNPDGRESWFRDPHTSSSSRSNLRPVDGDRDGLFDEDGPDDLDGDGQITQMWKKDPSGRFLRDRADPRVFVQVEPGQRGEWTPLGQEGIDNDGDGRINEDPPGGDDMNRNWPSDWQADYVQFGAGLYPFSNPEPRAIGQFILSRPNITAAQSYHNAGGMILRGPGASYRESAYPGSDRAVYDQIAAKGEDILPYYRSLVIYRDLYTVYGGFVNWCAEGLGIFSFTNEMWTAGKYFQRDITNPDDKRMWLFRDRLQFGLTFKDYTEIEHPTYGKVLVGGLNKWSSRVTPAFLLEEECHRNFAFTMYHADQMPLLAFERVEVARAGEGLWRLTAEVRNQKLIPTRGAWAREKGIGQHDLMLCTPAEGVSISAAGYPSSWLDQRMSPVRHEPGRLQLAGGIPGQGSVIFRWFLAGPEGGKVTLRYEAEKAKTIERDVVLEPTP
ncbi:MAG: peptidase M14 [Phycisphaerae bacterium]|nr:peptidase M14 [Phycisphaerae bacterium]